MVHNNVYQKMLGDPAWVQESLVSAAIAREAREKADLAHAFNFQPVWDQQMPTATGTILYGQVTVTNGSATVTGLNTVFTQQLSAGVSYLTFGNDPTKTQYKVSTITSDTSITLSSSYAGATATTSARLQTVLAGTASMSGNTITGTGTSFNTALAVGQWVVFSADPTQTAYQIAAITSATAATVVGAGATIASSTLTVKSYTNLALHEYAVALAMRPIATPDEARNVVDVSYIDLMGIPLRVMVSYVHIYQALFVTVDFGYALGVIRPDFGVIINC
jgi:hypothetical protein